MTNYLIVKQIYCLLAAFMSLQAVGNSTRQEQLEMAYFCCARASWPATWLGWTAVIKAMGRPCVFTPVTWLHICDSPKCVYVMFPRQVSALQDAN